MQTEPVKFTFKLVKMASGSGGDRYSTTLPPGTNPKTWDIYVPQFISRLSVREAVKSFTLTLKEGE
jgi:hypothetical protein